jgi:hypothetical protein
MMKRQDRAERVYTGNQWIQIELIKKNSANLSHGKNKVRYCRIKLNGFGFLKYYYVRPDPVFVRSRELGFLSSKTSFRKTVELFAER